MNAASRVSGIVEAFERASERDRSRRVLLHAQGRSLRFGEVVLRAQRLARFARDLEWTSGDRVIVATRDPIAAVSLHLGLMRNGLTSIVVDAEASARELEVLLDTAQPRGIFADTGLCAAVPRKASLEICEIAEPRSGRGRLFERLLGSDTVESRAFPGRIDCLEPTEPPASIDPELDAYVGFTSGSTAKPKGVRISHRALFAHLDTLRRVFHYDEDTRLLNVLPLHHTDGMNHGPLAAFVAGACVHRPLPFRLQDLGALLDSIYSERITHWIAVPTLLAMVDQLGSEPGGDFLESFDTDDFERIVCSAAPLPTALWKRFQQRFRVPVANVYGLTETVVGGLFNGGHGVAPAPGSVGVPVDCEARIVDAAGDAIGGDAAGELELRGENLFSGYFGDDTATRAAFHDGWFRTGDLAARDPDGSHRIVGRRKNLIIRGGFNVQPEEVSEALCESEGVVEAVTFGEPDEVFGERVVSAVTLFDGCGETESSLRSACRERLTAAKVPARIHILPALPKSASGKLQVDRTRELVEGLGRKRHDRALGAVEERVRELAAEAFDRPVASLQRSSTPGDTPGWDSFAHLELVVALEDVFDLSFGTRDILRIESLGDAIDIVGEKLA